MIRLSLLISVLVIGPVFASTSFAITFNEPFAYVPMTGGKMTAAYVTIKNDAKTNDKITGVTAEGFKAAEIHETFEKDGKTGMRRIEALAVPAAGSIELKPGGKHIMLFEPSKTFKPGDVIALTFTINGKPETASFKMATRPNTAH